MPCPPFGRLWQCRWLRSGRAC